MDYIQRNNIKIIPKGQQGLVTQSDNTRVTKPIIQERIPYKLKPNEFYFVDKKTGKKTLIKQKQETVNADNRTTNQRKQDQTTAKQIQKKQEADKNYEKGIETINALTKLTLPSTYIGPVFNNNGKSYLDNVISGEGTGNTAGNLAIDIFTPFGIKGINKGIQTGNRYYLARQIYKDINNSSLKSEQIPLNIGWGPKQTIPVSRASNSGNMQLFFPNRWDVVNEGANPHGIWFQGKLGYPRTDFTNPGKGEKAAKARALFANRPVQMQGNLTLEKPMITVGDVPNRSQLSYYADNAGADGLIYNGVYDNGYNNNQVILSFKKMNKTNDNKSPIKPSIGDVHNYVSSPDYLAQDFVKRNKSPYSIDIANHMYGLDESLNFVDYRAMNDYGRVFNERIKKTLPLAKQRGTLRIDKNPTIIVADSQGRQFLQNRFFEELNKVNGIHYGDPITPTGILAKKYYYKTSPAKDVFDIDPASFADRKNNTIVLVPSSGDYENMYKYTLPHEKTHIFIDGRKEAALFGDDRGFGALPRRDGYIDIDLDLYLNRPDEQLARGTQIKNYLGIVDESPITPEQLKYAAQNYVKDTGYDNNMTDFFRSIKDYKKAAKWLSLAPSVSPIIKTYSND